jgi:hypothetical protein
MPSCSGSRWREVLQRLCNSGDDVIHTLLPLICQPTFPCVSRPRCVDFLRRDTKLLLLFIDTNESATGVGPIESPTLITVISLRCKVSRLHVQSRRSTLDLLDTIRSAQKRRKILSFDISAVHFQCLVLTNIDSGLRHHSKSMLALTRCRIVHLVLVFVALLDTERSRFDRNLRVRVNLRQSLGLIDLGFERPRSKPKPVHRCRYTAEA